MALRASVIPSSPLEGARLKVPIYVNDAVTLFSCISSFAPSLPHNHCISEKNILKEIFCYSGCSDHACAYFHLECTAVVSKNQRYQRYLCPVSSNFLTLLPHTFRYLRSPMEYLGYMSKTPRKKWEQFLHIPISDLLCCLTTLSSAHDQIAAQCLQSFLWVESDGTFYFEQRKQRGKWWHMLWY